MYRKKHNIPTVYTCHSIVALESGGKKPGASLKRQLQLLRTADRVVVPSRSELAKLTKLYPFCTGKTTVIRHATLLQRSVAHGPSHHLLYVGRLLASKGIEQLFRAVALLRRDNKKVKLFMIGTGSKRYIRRLKALAKELGISSHIRWLGHRRQNEVQRMYASFGTLVMPSLQESFGMVALEALASGIPLVSTRNGGLSEFVNSKVAQVIPKVESQAIAAAVRQVWARKAVTRRRIAAGRKAAARHNWPKVAEQYEKLFKKLRR
jgi:glycosyltransferase involved in cell wall biosynthesis